MFSLGDVNFVDIKTFDAIEVVIHCLRSGPLNTSLNIIQKRKSIENELRTIRSLLLRCALCKVYEHLCVVGYLSSHSLHLLDKIFTIFVDTWDSILKEEELLLEEQKKKSFQYRLKKKRFETKASAENDKSVRGSLSQQEEKEYNSQKEEEKENELLELKFRESFPDFYHQFDDILLSKEGGEDSSQTTEIDENSFQNKSIKPTSLPSYPHNEQQEQHQQRSNVSDQVTMTTDTIQRDGVNEEEEWLSHIQMRRLHDEEVFQLCKIHTNIFARIKPHFNSWFLLKQNSEQVEVPHSPIHFVYEMSGAIFLCFIH